jgi:hypothetical protein
MEEIGTTIHTTITPYFNQPKTRRKVTEISSATNTTKKLYTYFHNFPYLCTFRTIPYKEWPKKRPYTYAQIVDKTHPNGWANARRADNGTLM